MGSITVVRKYFSSLRDRKDGLKRIMSLFAEDAEVVYPGGGRFGGRFSGLGEIERLYEGKFKEDLSLVDVLSTNIVAYEGCVAVEFEASISGEDSPTPFKASGSMFFDIDNSKIHRISVYLVAPEPISAASKELIEEFEVKDMGLLSAVAWAVV